MNLRFHSGLRYVQKSDDEILFSFYHDGENYFRVAYPAISDYWQQLQRCLRQNVAIPAELGPLVDKLLSCGVLVRELNSSSNIAELSDIYFSLSDEKASQLETTPILIGGQPNFAQDFTDAFHEWGMKACTLLPHNQGQLPNIPEKAIVVIVDHMPGDMVRSYHFHAMKLHYPFLPVRLNGFSAVVGPFVIPGESACYHCYEMRYQSNLQHFREYKTFLNNEAYAENAGANKHTTAIVSRLVATETIKYCLGRHVSESPMAVHDAVCYPHTINKILCMDNWQFSFELHSLIKYPRCPACGLKNKEKSTVKPWMDYYQYQKMESAPTHV
ncbi:TOMM precursor leader peptide-binding protein [Paenibacillus dendritiformis]|uniref:TOMM precursor leader peptide-binding protein n=1 Tax=Paenibacillus dendritiformis TaxID=130049 RepID=UPI0036521B42